MFNLKFNQFLIECIKDFFEDEEEIKQYKISNAELIDFEKKPDIAMIEIKTIKNKIVIEFR